MNVIDVLRQELRKTESKLFLCDLAMYSLFAVAVVAGVLVLPYSLWVLIFRDGSFSRILGAFLMCVSCWGGIRCIGFFKQRMHYIESLRSFGFSDADAHRAWDDYLQGRHDALRLMSARKAGG